MKLRLNGERAADVKSVRSTKLGTVLFCSDPLTNQRYLNGGEVRFDSWGSAVTLAQKPWVAFSSISSDVPAGYGLTRTGGT